MATIIDYVRGTQQTFSEKPFSTADSIVLAQLAYLHMPPIVPRVHLVSEDERDVDGVPTPAGVLPQHNPSVWNPLGPVPVSLAHLNQAEWLRQMTDKEDPHTPIRRLTETVLESRRFRSVRVANAVEPIDVRESNRFSALTYDLGDGTLYIAFRGTDGTFAGWYEDYRLLFTVPPLPSQAQAARYTAQVLKGWNGAIILGGHSMGGNLAAYVAASAPREVQERIHAVYEHDSPGFIDSFLATEGFQRVRNKIHKTVPESSMIGMLFDSGVEETIVRSAAHGVNQHHMTSWLFDDDTLDLSRSTRLNRYYSSAFAKLMNDWRENLSVEDRRRFIDDLFDALYQTGAVDFPGFVQQKEPLRQFMAAIRRFPADEQERLRATVSVLIRILIGRAPGGPVVKPFVKSWTDDGLSDEPSHESSDTASKRSSEKPRKRLSFRKKAKKNADQNADNGIKQEEEH